MKMKPFHFGRVFLCLIFRNKITNCITVHYKAIFQLVPILVLGLEN
jgi:hypothetical protein